MKQAWIGYSLVDENLLEEVARVLGTNNFEVELFGVRYLDEKLPSNYSIIDYRTRETLAICKDGEIIDDKEEIERIEAIEQMVADLICECGDIY